MKHVHKFIVVESEYSHSGQKKKLNFNIDNFKKFKDKIIYLVIKMSLRVFRYFNPETQLYIKRMNSLKRIEQSYDYMMKGILDAQDEDLIFK